MNEKENPQNVIEQFHKVYFAAGGGPDGVDEAYKYYLSLDRASRDEIINYIDEEQKKLDRIFREMRKE